MTNWINAKAIKNSTFIVIKQIALIVAALLFATIFLKASQFEAFAILQGIKTSMTTDLAGTIRWATPLILAGLAISITFKAQVFNLGVDGQLYMGAAAATVVALALPNQNGAVSLILVFVAAMIAGAVFALIPALLKVYFETNEVVSTLLLNFIAVLYMEYLVTGPLRDPDASTNLNASQVLPENTWLPRLEYFEPSVANVGIYIAIAMAILISFIYYRTKLGYEIKLVGSNPRMATYGGMMPKSTTIKVMAISGALAGIIGAIEVTAIQHKLLAGFNPGYGFDGIVVSLLANNNPVGVIFSGIFFGSLKNAGINMERFTDVPSAVTEVVMAIIILTISAEILMPKIMKKLKSNKKRNIQKQEVSQND